MEWIFHAEGWIAFLTLAVMEVVLGIDNIIFISILASKLPESSRKRARSIGLSLAMIIRIGLLFSLSFIMRLTAPLFVLLEQEISGRDIILILGGLFLLGKSTYEIHNKLEGGSHGGKTPSAPSFLSVIVQILLLDIIFSLDSVITAVGMTDKLGIMITAVVISVIVMIVFIKSVSDFVERHPTVKMLALSFLLLIGVMLVAEGFDQHISKGYIYFAMGFSVFVEMLNLRLKRVAAEPVHLHGVRPPA